MSNADQDDHTNRLRYLFLAAQFYRDDWREDSSIVNWRRWRWAKARYETAKADGERRFGLTRHQGQEGTR